MSLKRATSVGILGLVCLLASKLYAQNLDSLLQNKRSYPTVSIGDRALPKIDGILDDSIWYLGQWQGSFTQQQPVGGVPGTENTYVKVLYDRSNLFVAIICQDSKPGEIRDIFDRRDALNGDMTGIALDSYFDKRTAFEFNMSAAGQKMDLKHLGDYQWDMNWNGVWDGASAPCDSGWIAEMRIPFSQVRYENREKHVWGMHVWRWISRNYEEDQWQFIPREAPAMVYLFGELHGLEEIRSSRQVEFLPYASAGLRKTVGNDPWAFSPNAGIDAKVGISSDYTLDLSVNPDYGQVEADPSVLNLSAFEVFYEEKRPFFMEGNEIFDFELDGDIAYYSRRIGSPPSHPGYVGEEAIQDIPSQTTILGAAKLTGKSRKGLSVGLMNGLTARAHGKIKEKEGGTRPVEVAPLSNYLAARLKREIDEGNTIVGGMFSLVNRMSSDSMIHALDASDALSGGVDFLHYWDNKNYFVQAKAIGSQVSGSREAMLGKQLSHIHRFQRPGADYLEVDSSRTSLGGHGALLEVGKGGGTFNFLARGQYRSPGLNLNDLGFIRQADFIGQGVELQFQMNDPGKWIRNYEVEVKQEARWSTGGEHTFGMTGIEFSTMSVRNWSYHLSYEYEFAHLDTRELRGGPALRIDGEHQLGAYVRSNGAKDLSGNLGMHYIRKQGLPSHMEVVHGGLTWLPVRKLKLRAMAQWTSVDYYQQFVDILKTDAEDLYLVGSMDRQTVSLTFRAEWFFTPEMSLQYYGSPYYSVGDYDQFKRVDRATSHDLDKRLDALEVAYDPNENSYSFEFGGDPLSFGNPDFSFMQFRSNLVFRWEYNLGSTLYLVWAHDRSGWEDLFNPIGDITGDLFGLEGNHMFMFKLNFWFSV